MVVGILSCKGQVKSIPDTSAIDDQKVEQDIGALAEKTLFSQNEDEYIHTNYEYNDSKGRQLSIQNSYPKGGLKYTDSRGKDYRYAIFWTHITNKSDNSLDLNIEFSSDSIELPNLPSIYFKFFLPPDKMTPDKAPQFNYGLKNLKNSLDNGFGKPSSLQKTIHSKESYTFYVVALSNKGVDGVVRAGFSLEEQNVLFRLNTIELRCGHIEYAVN